MPEFMDEQSRYEHGCLGRELPPEFLSHLADVVEVLLLMEEDDES